MASPSTSRIKRLVKPSDKANSAASFLPVLAFLLLYGICAAFWNLPTWVGWLYLAVSTLAFVTYGVDKLAARRGTWRVPEKTLLVLGLVGGWPGAVLAQQAFRHKSSKTSFRLAFWLSVVLNVGAFVLLVTPLLRRL